MSEKQKAQQFDLLWGLLQSQLGYTRQMVVTETERLGKGHILIRAWREEVLTLEELESKFKSQNPYSLE